MRHPFLITLACLCLFLMLGEHSPAFSKTQEGLMKGEEQLSPENLKLIRKLGPEAQSALASGDYDAAFTKAKTICDLAPNVYEYQFFLGNAGFAAGKMEESIQAYDAVIRLVPSSKPQLWQRGLALFYAKRFEEGVQQFEIHQTVNSQDVENAVWHLLCAAQISDVQKARKKLIPITGDTRVPMSQVYELFAGRETSPETVLQAAAKTSGRVKKEDPKYQLQNYYAHLYLGLYFEMQGNHDAADKAMKYAKQINPLPKSNFMGQVADVHLRLRALEAKQKRTPASGATERVPK